MRIQSAFPLLSIFLVGSAFAATQSIAISDVKTSNGQIEFNFTADPERYVDCGQRYSMVIDDHGERKTEFPAARAEQAFEIVAPGIAPRPVRQTLSLEGRVVAAQNAKPFVRYVLTRTITDPDEKFSGIDRISFENAAGGTFPADETGHGLACVPNGALEKEIAVAVHKHADWISKR